MNSLAVVHSYFFFFPEVQQQTHDFQFFRSVPRTYKQSQCGKILALYILALNIIELVAISSTSYSQTQVINLTLINMT